VGTGKLERLGHGRVDAARVVGRKLPLRRTIQVGAEAEDLQEMRQACREGTSLMRGTERRGDGILEGNNDRRKRKDGRERWREGTSEQGSECGGRQ